MITVNPIGPPSGFAAKVVRPAKAWVTKKGWVWTALPPAGQSRLLPAYWTAVLDDLHEGYSGICAYLSVYTHRSLDDTSVDHYKPKSKSAVSLAYDWSNYRLASRPMNTNKGDHQDVLDPFALPPGLFVLNLLSGKVQIDTAVAPIGSPLHAQAKVTLKDRLKLNDGEYRELRLRILNKYLEARRPTGRASAKRALVKARADLLLESPFIHHEVVRQGW